MTLLSAQSLATRLPDFLIAGPGHALAWEGIRRRLAAGPLASLAARAAGFFAAGHDGPQRLVGAVPFDPQAADALFQPAREGTVPAGVPGAQGPAAARVPVHHEPSPSAFRAAVARAVERIGAGEFDKIVLSRSLHLAASGAEEAGNLLARLRADALATVFSVPLPGAARRLIGATPELLLERRGRQAFSHPLAGSARRSAEPQADRAAAAALLASDKDRREHRMAAEMVLDTLAPWCREIAADEIRAVPTARMWHLGTRITGELRDPGTPCAALLAALHPTPAVCGLPRAPALAALPGLEGYDRGFYAGAVGWLDASGDGCWYLALRCAELSAAGARLYAGAGVVAGSDPAAEEAETSAKFLAMLAAFGIDESGNPTTPEE